MSVGAKHWALSQTVAGGSSPRIVLFFLADWVIGDDQTECWPTVDTLSFETGMNRQTIMKATASLEKQGLIEKRVEWNGLRKRVFYRLCGFDPKVWVNAPRPKNPSARTSEISDVRNLGGSESRTSEISYHGGTKSRTTDSPKSRTTDGTKSRTGTGINRKEQEVTGIASAASASASEPTLFPEVDQPKPKKTSRRKPQVPCPWKPGTPLPDHLKEWAAENFPTLNAEQVFQEFIGWMIAKDVRNAVWDQAFRNWMANELKKQAKRGGYYRESRKPVDRSHFAHEKPFSQKDFSMTEQEKRDMAYIFALDAQEKAEKERAATGAKE